MTDETNPPPSPLTDPTAAARRGPEQQLPAWLTAVGEGWRPILERLHVDLLRVAPTYGVTQVKEKFGGLRVYLLREPSKVSQLLAAAEREAARTCEVCGQPGKLRQGSWLKTLCDEHAAGRAAAVDPGAQAAEAIAREESRAAHPQRNPDTLRRGE